MKYICQARNNNTRLHINNPNEHERGSVIPKNNMRAARNINPESERISETRKWKFCSSNEDLIQKCHLQKVLIILVDIRLPTWSGIFLIPDKILIYLKAWINITCWDAFINDLLGHVGINQHHHHHLSELTHPGVDIIVTQQPSSYQLNLLTLASITQSLTKLKNCSAWPIPSLFGTISHNILKSFLKNNPLDKTKLPSKNKLKMTTSGKSLMCRKNEDFRKLTSTKRTFKRKHQVPLKIGS